MLIAGIITAKEQLFLLRQATDTLMNGWDEFPISKKYTNLPENAKFNHFVNYHEIFMLTVNGTEYGPVCPSEPGLDPASRRPPNGHGHLPPYGH